MTVDVSRFVSVSVSSTVDVCVALCVAVAGLAVAAPVPAREVGIEMRLDAAHRLTVRYRAPSDVALLRFTDADPRVDRVFRSPRMVPANGCGALVAGGIALQHGAGCEDGALFVVAPGVLGLDATYEPAQPTSDGGVLFYTRWYAAAAPGLAQRWTFVPEAGGYVVAQGRRSVDAVSRVTPVPAGVAVASGTTPEEIVETALHQQGALEYVFLGHAPFESAGGVLWVRDPALPAAITGPVAETATLAWRAFAEAAQASPAGPVAIVMLAAPAPGARAGFHGDRSEGRMLRLSFQAPFPPPSDDDVAEWRHFTAHEVAHLWNRGVFESDETHPWLHEGDAEWASLNLLHDAHELSDAAFTARLERAVNGCLLVRGERVASTMPAGRDGDDPYACGLALQLLGWVELRRRDPGALDTPIARWGALHREFPSMAPDRFSAFFDRDRSTLMRELLLGDATPFASTYRKDLASRMLFQTLTTDPTAPELRDGFAFDLAARLVRADCGQLGFSLGADAIVLDDDLRCQALPAGGRIVAVAGVPLPGKPRSAWAAAKARCADGGRIDVGLADGRHVAVACPADLPDAPAWIKLPADGLRRIGLMARPVRDDAPRAAASTAPAPVAR